MTKYSILTLFYWSFFLSHLQVVDLSRARANETKFIVTANLYRQKKDIFPFFISCISFADITVIRSGLLSGVLNEVFSGSDVRGRYFFLRRRT